MSKEQKFDLKNNSLLKIFVRYPKKQNYFTTNTFHMKYPIINFSQTTVYSETITICYLGPYSNAYNIVYPLSPLYFSLNNIEKYADGTLILKVNHACCVHISDCGLIAYQRKQAPFTRNKILWNKLCFDIKGFVIQRRTHSLRSDEPHIILLSNITVVWCFVIICYFVSQDFCKHY